MNQHGRSTRILVIALILPALVTLVALAITFSLARTSASVIVHWNASGGPDGYGTPYTYPLLLAVIVLPLVAILGGIVVVSTHRGPVTPVIKLLGVVELWLSVGLGTGFVAELALQTGGVPYTSVAPIPIGFAVAIVVAAAAWFALPRVEKRTASQGPAVTPVALAAGERATWIRSASASGAMLWGLIGLTVVLGGVVVVAVTSTNGAAWWVSFIPLVVLLLVLSNMIWTVRVDVRGVRIRSLVGLPTFTVPLADISSASVVDVHPLADFGGWGVRFGLNKSVGIVLKTGQGLEIRRLNGRSLVVTVDDAESAAALVNGLVEQRSRVVS